MLGFALGDNGRGMYGPPATGRCVLLSGWLAFHIKFDSFFFIEQLFVFAFAFLPDSVISLCVSHFCPLCTLQ